MFGRSAARSGAAGKYITYVKTGVPGMAYLRLDPEVEWPANLQIKVPQ